MTKATHQSNLDIHLSTDFKGFEVGLQKHRIPRDKREEMKGKWEKEKAVNKANDITCN